MGVDDMKTTVDSDCRASPWWHLINGGAISLAQGSPQPGLTPYLGITSHSHSALLLRCTHPSPPVRVPDTSQISLGPQSSAEVHLLLECSLVFPALPQASPPLHTAAPANSCLLGCT